MFFKRCILVVAIALSASILSAPLARAASLADQVPDDAIVYLSWSGSNNLGPDYAGSHMAAITKDSGLPKVFTEYVPGLLNTIGQKEPQVAPMMKIIGDLSPVLWQYPSAFYFGGIQAPEGDSNAPTVGLALICDAGNDAAKVAGQIQQIINHSASDIPVPLLVQTQDTLVIVTVGKPLPPIASALSASASYKAALAATSPNPVTIAYIDVDKLLVQINRTMPLTGPGNGKRWNTIRDQLALGEMHQVICTSGFEGKNWVSHTFIAAPTHDKGIPALLAGGKPITDADLAVIPVSATVAAVGDLDLAGLFDEVTAGIAAADPRTANQIDQGIATANQFVGIDIRKDLLGSFGSRWTAYIDPKSTGSSIIFSGVLINTSVDATKADTTLTAALTSLCDTANRLLQGKASLSIRSGTTKGVNIHTISFPMVSPAWAAHDGKLYMALYPQTLSSVFVSPKSSIKDSPKFIAAKAKLGVTNLTSLMYVDQAERLPMGYGNQLFFLQYLSGASDMLLGAQTPWNLMPPLGVIMPELEPSMAGKWVDEAGIHFKSVESFPSSNSLCLSDTPAAEIAPAALAASILLPTLNSARESANRVKCMSNLRQIGMGIMLYENDNRGQTPPDLETLIMRGDLTPMVFVCPDSNVTSPAPGIDDPEALSQWMSDNCSYEYLGAGVKANKITQPGQTVIAYEKESNHDGKGISLLFADGHVEFQTLAEARQTIEQSKQKLDALRK